MWSTGDVIDPASLRFQQLRLPGSLLDVFRYVTYLLPPTLTFSEQHLMAALFSVAIY